MGSQEERAGPSFTLVVDRSEAPTVVVVAMSGEFDGLAAPVLVAEFDRMHQATTVVVDASEVRFIDAGGLRALILLSSSFKDKGGVAFYLVPSTQVRRLLELVADPSDPLFDVFASVGEATTQATGRP